MTSRRAVIALASVALAGAVTLTGCSGGSGNGSSTTKVTPSSTFVPTRWWSNSAGSAGSTIDAKNPGAAAAKLHPSVPEYCGMLSATVKAGKSILPGITSADPALLVTTEAFVAELTQTAPSEVAGAWKVLGPVVVALVRSGGTQSALPSTQAGAVQQAAAQIASHARTVCKVELSTASSGSSTAKPSPTSS